MSAMHWATVASGAWALAGVGVMAYQYPAGLPEAAQWQALVVFAPLALVAVLAFVVLWRVR